MAEDLSKENRALKAKVTKLENKNKKLEAEVAGLKEQKLTKSERFKQRDIAAIKARTEALELAVANRAEAKKDLKSNEAEDASLVALVEIAEENLELATKKSKLRR